MNLRLLIPVLLVFACSSLLAQPQITNITYEGNEAILSRNTPPAGIVYYWQGASCGMLMNHSGSTTVATTDGIYYLREYNSSSSTWATSCASTLVQFPDITSPVLSNVTTGPIEEGDPIDATSNEDGMIYLVPDGTAANVGAITAASVADAAATAASPVSLSTAGIALGDYIVYAVDGFDNVSSASALITVVDLTAPILSDVTAGPIEPGTDILATSNENGMLFLVPDGTAPNIGDISAAQVAQVMATANVPGTLATTGIALGDYVVYAADDADNISAASPAITVQAANYIDLNNANPNQVQLYPVSVIDILHIKSRIPVTSVKVYSLAGSQVIHMATPTDQVDMSSLHAGVYIVSVRMEDDVIYIGKVSKE